MSNSTCWLLSIDGTYLNFEHVVTVKPIVVETSEQYIPRAEVHLVTGKTLQLDLNLTSLPKTEEDRKRALKIARAVVEVFLDDWGGHIIEDFARPRPGE